MNPRLTTLTSGRSTASLAALATLALLGPLALSACQGHDVDPNARASRGIDARAYVDDYEEDEVLYDLAAPAPSSVAQEGGATENLTGDQTGDQTGDLGQPGRVPDPDQDNVFVDAGTSGFVDTQDDALSTFALDVDTGSLGVARSLLNDGYAVPPASIRPEEWINSLPYDDAAPTDTDLAISAETGVAPSLDDGTQLVRVGVTARVVDPRTRPDVHVTLVVDRSGSMDIRERLGLVQSSLALLADRLRDDDTVAVVSFEDEARPILEPTRVAETETILDAVDRLEPGGGTNLDAGLMLGYEQAREAYDPKAINLVVLCSDGVANAGITGAGALTRKIAQEGADGIHLVTVGYGMGNYNDHLMEQLADLGDGFYSYVDTFDEAERLFGDELTTTLVPVAAEARTQVAFDPDVVSSYRLIGYENREIADEDFEDLTVDAGELGSGHHATALYEVRLADGVPPGSPIGTATVLWAAADGSDSEPHSADVALAAAGPQATGSSSLDLAAAAADLAQVLKGRAPFSERGVDLADVTARIEVLADADVAGAAELLDLAELAEQVDR